MTTKTLGEGVESERRRVRGMGARMVAFLESHSGLDCLDCLAEKGKPESKRHKLETPQLMPSGRGRNQRAGA